MFARRKSLFNVAGHSNLIVIGLFKGLALIPTVHELSAVVTDLYFHLTLSFALSHCFSQSRWIFKYKVLSAVWKISKDGKGFCSEHFVLLYRNFLCTL